MILRRSKSCKLSLHVRVPVSTTSVSVVLFKRGSRKTLDVVVVFSCCRAYAITLQLKTVMCIAAVDANNAFVCVNHDVVFQKFCFISHVTTSETEIKLFQALKVF